MELIFAALVLVLVFGVTVLYKILPYRTLGDKKPFISFMPKYKTQVALPGDMSSIEKLSEVLAKYGFSLKSTIDGTAKFVRGSILGDISIKLLKVVLKVTEPVNNRSEFSVEAGWVVAFDTGDFWSFLSELKQKIET